MPKRITIEVDENTGRINHKAEGLSWIEVFGMLHGAGAAFQQMYEATGLSKVVMDNGNQGNQGAQEAQSQPTNN